MLETITNLEFYIQQSYLSKVKSWWLDAVHI